MYDPIEASREYLRDNFPRIRRSVEEWKQQYGGFPGIILLSAQDQRIALIAKEDLPKLLADLPNRALAQELAEREYKDDAAIVVQVPGNTMRTSFQEWEVSEDCRAAGAILVHTYHGRDGRFGLVQEPARFKERKRRSR
jgi:hypothetical protein